MVNYGYGPNSPNWNENKRPQLAGLLSYMIGKMNRDGKFTQISIHDRPYLRIDDDERVIIEKLTQLPKELQEELIANADKIYADLMASKLGKIKHEVNGL